MYSVTVITVDEAPFAGMKRAMPRILTEAHDEMASFWHTDILPAAFEPAAKRRHQHRPRSAKYNRRKRALAAKGIVKKGGEADNVFSGQTEESLETLATIRSNRKGATVSMIGPRYITQPVGEEITRVSSGEQNRLTQKLAASIEDRLQKFREPVTTRSG